MEALTVPMEIKVSMDKKGDLPYGVLKIRTQEGSREKSDFPSI